MLSLKNNQGFTLIELMVVIGILAILVNFGLPTYKSFTARSKQTEVKIMLDRIHKQFETGYVSPIYAQYQNSASAWQRNWYAQNTNHDKGWIYLWNYGSHPSFCNEWNSPNGQTLLGVNAENCASLNYSYFVDAGKHHFYLRARSVKIFPGCSVSDVWISDANKNIIQISDGIKECVQ